MAARVRVWYVMRMKVHCRFRQHRLALRGVAAAFLVAAAGFGARAEDATVAVEEAHMHWSDPETAATIAGKSYHGPWGNQSTALTLDHLPKHQWVRVRFDLYIIGSWDGSSPVWGPDLWSLSARGAQRLIFASFCGWGYAGNDEQSYPDDYPHTIHPAWTGATQRDIVDIKDSDPPKNGVYKVEVLFPHTEAQLILDFAGSYQDPPREIQRWGIGNVEASTLPEAPPTDAATLPALWEELASEDSVKANAALWRFIGAGAKAVSFIKDQVNHMPEGLDLSDEDGLRLHRAHRIVRIIGGEGSGGLCFRMDQLSIEYANKYRNK